MPLTNAGAGLCLSGPGLVAATRHFSLYVGDPSGSGTEVSATGYGRLSRTTSQMTVTNNAVSVSAGEWEDSAQASWGTPTYVGMHSAASGGTLYAYQEISPSLSEIITGTRVFANAGDITITIPLS